MSETSWGGRIEGEFRDLSLVSVLVGACMARLALIIVGLALRTDSEGFQQIVSFALFAGTPNIAQFSDMSLFYPFALAVRFEPFFVLFWLGCAWLVSRRPGSQRAAAVACAGSAVICLSVLAGAAYVLFWGYYLNLPTYLDESGFLVERHLSAIATVVAALLLALAWLASRVLRPLRTVAASFFISLVAVLIAMAVPTLGFSLFS